MHYQDCRMVIRFSQVLIIKTNRTNNKKIIITTLITFLHLIFFQSWIWYSYSFKWMDYKRYFIPLGQWDLLAQLEELHLHLIGTCMTIQNTDQWPTLASDSLGDKWTQLHREQSQKVRDTLHCIGSLNLLHRLCRRFHFFVQWSCKWPHRIQIQDYNGMAAEPSNSSNWWIFHCINNLLQNHRFHLSDPE